MIESGIELRAYTGRLPFWKKTLRFDTPGDRGVLMRARVTPDEGGRTDREHWFAQISLHMLLALKSENVSEQRKHWNALQHEVEAIVAKLTQEEEQLERN